MLTGGDIMKSKGEEAKLGNIHSLIHLFQTSTRFFIYFHVLILN